jgi:2-polyprenyl-3-methyl-5-hydroxy-6-metoxy-1,4-benzoquinol methylase
LTECGNHSLHSQQQLLAEGQDFADRISLYSWREDPNRYEEIVRAQLDEAERDPAIALLLRSNYINRDPSVAFEEFRQSFEFQKIKELLATFGATPSSRLCEIGGGPGFLVWALHEAGFHDISLLEPNANFYTGTGYLRARSDACDIKIINDKEQWYAGDDSFDFILTRNCIHHFPNIGYIAACIRQKMKSRGRWFAWREQFAENSQQLYALLSSHPYAYQYGLYEYAYPVAHYVDSFTLAGLRLLAVVPFGYANNALIRFEPSGGDEKTRAFTLTVDRLLKKKPEATVRKLSLEIFTNRYLRGVLGPRRYSFPSALVFERVPVEQEDSQMREGS